jgi:hypothetical protein
MGTVTIRGGTGEPDQTLVYTEAGAFQLARSIAGVVNKNLAITVKLYNNGGLFKVPSSVGALVIDGGKPVSISAATGTKKQYVVTGKLGAEYAMAAGESMSIAGIGADTIFAGQSTHAGNTLVAAGTRDVVELGDGAVTVTEAGTLAHITGGSGSAVIHDTGVGDTVTTGSGAETVYASKNGHYILGSGQDVIEDSQAQGASDTIDASGGGGYTVFGGTSDLITTNTGLYFQGGNGSTTIKGSGNDILLGNPGGSIDFRATGNATYAASGGGDTFNGAAATGNLTLFTSGPSATGDMLTGSQGNDQFIAEGNNATLTGSHAASGVDDYVFVDQGSTTQTVVITNFNPANDAIGLIGYGAEPAADEAALSGATTAGGITTVTLSDGTTIQLLGAPALASFNFF